MYSTISDMLEPYALPETTHKVIMAILLLAECCKPRLYPYGDGTLHILTYGKVPDKTRRDILSLGFRFSPSDNVVVDL